MVPYDWWVAPQITEELRSVLQDVGEQCVGTTLTTMLLVWHVNSWGSCLMVRTATLSNTLFQYQSTSLHVGAYPQYYRYGSGSGPIWLNGYQCTGNETSIFDCPISYNSNDGLYYCNHNNDAELFCPGKQ